MRPIVNEVQFVLIPHDGGPEIVISREFEQEGLAHPPYLPVTEKGRIEKRIVESDIYKSCEEGPLKILQRPTPLKLTIDLNDDGTMTVDYCQAYQSWMEKHKRRLIITLENSEPLPFEEDWIEFENGRRYSREALVEAAGQYMAVRTPFEHPGMEATDAQPDHIIPPRSPRGHPPG